MPAVSTTFHLLIPNQDGTHLLMRKTSSGCRLPRVSGAKRTRRGIPDISSWTHDSRHLSAAILAELSIRAYPRRAACYRTDSVGGTCHVVVVLDIMHRTSQLAPGLQWLSRNEALSATWAYVHPAIDVAAFVTELFEETMDGVVPPRRPPWRKFGWVQQITPWILSRLKANQLETVDDRIEPVRNTVGAVVLRCALQRPEGQLLNSGSEPAATDRDASTSFYGVYVKASLSYVSEPQNTAAVASLLPQVTPKVLSINKEFNAMIQLSLGTSCYFSDEDVLNALWGFQKRSLQVIDELKEAGLCHRGPMQVASLIKKIVNHPALRPKANELIELESRSDEFKGICETIGNFKIPHTLVHGDFVRDNMGPAVGCVHDIGLFDWNTSRIGHPFFDLKRITDLNMFANGLQDLVVMHSYLKRWEVYESQKNIRTAFRIFGPLMHCQNLYDLLQLYDNMEPCEQEEWQSAIKDRVRLILSEMNKVKKFMPNP